MKTADVRKTPKAKTRHSLSLIDKEALTATCVVCGPTVVRRIKRKNGSTYECITLYRTRYAAYLRTHPRISRLQQRRNTSHVLSNVDDENKTATCSICGLVGTYIRRRKGGQTRVCRNAARQRSIKAERNRQSDNREFIESYKLAHGCKNCDSPNVSQKLQLHARGKDHRSDPINWLLHLNRERLKLELQKYDVLCKSCHDRVHAKPSPTPKRRRIKRNPPPFMYDA